jgi:hypothetical protein
MTATADFDAALQTVTQERGAVYGSPLDDFEIAQEIKAAVAACEDIAIRHAMEMIAVKLARLTHTPTHVDSIIDIAGYARTMVMILDERRHRDETAD